MMKKLSLFLLTTMGACSAQAEIIKIPKESGFSGFVMAGVGAVEYESNMFKGASDDNSSHNGLNNSPDSHSSAIPLFGVDLRYTFANSGTQLFFGNLIQDAVRFDFTQQLGIRQQISDMGIVSLGYVFPLMATETWSDPYQSGHRKETDMKSGGARMAWDQILNSNFNAAYTVRKFDLDKERSGASLAQLTDHERDQLDRNGDTQEFALSYDWNIAPNHVLRPEITFTKGDFDGKAMSYDKTMVQLSYGVTGSQWSLVTNAFGGQVSYDADNPIYGKKADSNEFGLSTTFFWHQLFGVNGLSGLVSASYSKSDSDIDFYDAYVSSVGTSLMYRF